MDESTNLSNFELLLKKNTAKKTSVLYSSTSGVNNTTIKPQDVLNSVYSQIKTMQLADGRFSKNVCKNTQVKSGFMTVNNLPVYNEIPKQITFETQCVSDTQLINVTEDAEAIINTHKGMTQEFNTDFTHTDMNNDDTVSVTHDKLDRENMIETQEFETTFTQTNIDDTVSFLHDRNEKDDNFLTENDCCDEESRVAMKNVDTLKEICNRVVIENTLSANMSFNEDNASTNKNNEHANITVNTRFDNQIIKNNLEANTNLIDEVINLEEDIDMDNVIETLNNTMEVEDERSPSPVFIKKKNQKARTPSPFVVSLESFEKFERIAIPLIDSNNDINTCKHLIDSQILAEELCLNDADTMFNENGPLSPILERNNEFVQENCPDLIKRVKDIAANLDLREKRSDSLKDEILFSSDEENELMYREFEDIPLTAVLDTSFDSQLNALEDTMYSGFHTASYKSIQISSDAFKKAQSILDDNTNNCTEFSLTKLVDICDEKSFNKSNVDVQEKLNFITKTEKIFVEKHGQRSNKDVDMDEIPKAKETSDINYSDTIKKPPEKKNIVFKAIAEVNEEEKSIPDINIDDVIIQEFENIEMSLEDKENNDIDSKIDSFMGFRTASNKNIDVSDAAKAKMKDVFQDIDLGEIRESEFDPLNVIDLEKSHLLKEGKEVETTFSGFKPANNKNIKISAQALEKSRKILEDNKEFNTDVGEAKDKILPTDYYNQPSSSKTDFAGFNKANKDNKLSDVTMFKLNKYFNDIDKKDYKDNEKVEKPKNILKRFRSASSRSMKIFENLERNERIEELNKDESLKNELMSKENVERSMKMSKDFDTDTSKSVHDNQPNIHKAKTDSILFKGFQTASKKPMKISVQALERSKKIFQDIDGNIESDKKCKFQKINKEVVITKEVVNVKKLNEKKANCLFKTASNKEVTVSEAALAKCKKLFEDIDNTIDDIKEEKTFGFQPAKKKVDVSKDIKENKYIFRDIKIPDIEPTFNGFQTANNKKVDVSKDALEKTKAFFNVEEISGNFKGFQTANKKTVHISDTALAKCKEIFKDMEDVKINTNDVKINKGIGKSIFSFQTASNKNIDVSENSLKKSKLLLEESKHLNEKQINFDKNVQITNIGLDTDLDLINTEVLNDFETSISKDLKTPRKNKRSGSPIISCPRAKKKKFQTPYKEITNVIKDNPKPIEVLTNTTIKFDENYKKIKKYKLNDLTNHRNNIDTYITNYNLDNILDFEFNIERNNITNTKLTVPQLKDIFICAVNKNLIPEGWLDLQLKLIIWKLLSYEVKYNFICTAKEVIYQLKYRYDKELYNTERSALRKIYEKDDVASKTMVLCVAGILIDGVSVNSGTNTNQIELLLTDGWYFIKATTDKMLSKLVSDGKIVIGCKLVTCGAELVNCEGISPWEDTSSVRLKIFGNSTRPARWDTKLGYSRSAILSQLSSVKLDGGKISRLKVFVTRVYPMLYVEKFEDGSTVTRSERLEHLHQVKFESERELMMESIYEEVQREFNDQDSQDSELVDAGKTKCYDSGSQIARVLKHSRDPIEMRAQLTSSQLHLLQDHTTKHHEKMYQAIQNRVRDKMAVRNVVSLARGRIASLSDDGVVTKGMLSVWKPNDAILDIFKEGSWIEIMNTVPTAIRYSEIQITAGRQSVFRAKKNKIEISRHLSAMKRTCYKISDVTQNPTTTTDYNEIDTVGIVFLIEPNKKEFESNRNFQNVYLADADKNIISVNFWGGIKKFGFENILDTGQILACANLQKRAGNTRKNIPQFRVTEFSYFTKTPKNVQARDMVEEMNKKLDGLDRRKFCDDCIAIKSNYAAIRCLNDNENESPYRFHKGDYSLGQNKMFIDTPQGVKPYKTEDANLNLTGLDFESTFKQDTQELSPNTLMRKKKVNEKIAKLKMYGEPPPLSPITIIDRSVNAKNSYKSPLVSNTPILPKNVAIVNKLPEERIIDTREKSPVFSVKRTYVSVPVKLNFANESKNDSVDHFAEEFDGSPPLSLD